MREIILPTMKPEEVLEDIGNFFLAKMKQFRKNGCVVGLSGGVDSTLTAAIASYAFKKDDNGYEVVGRILPSRLNSPESELNGVKVAQKLGIIYKTISIEDIVEAHRKVQPEVFESKYDAGNLMSEIRASILHSEAAAEGKSVAGTGNKDEDFGIGYYTLFGDGAVHFSPIGGLSKRLVRELAAYMGFEDIASREPTAELEQGQTDFKDLGYSYDFVELLGEGLQQGFGKEELRDHPQVFEQALKDFKRYESLYGESKFKTVGAAVEDFYNRHDNIAAPKAKLMNVEIAPVTLYYNGEKVRR